MNPYPELIRARVRTLIERRGLALPALADRAGLSDTHIRQLLRGVRNPSLDVLWRLEQALGAPILTTAGRYEKRLKPRVPKEKGKASKKVRVEPLIDLDRLSSEE